MKATRFVLALVATASRWGTCSAAEKQKLLHFHTQSLQDELEDLKFEEFSICLRIFSQLFQYSLPDFLSGDEMLSESFTEIIQSVDSKEELLSDLVQLLRSFMRNQNCREYLQSVESSHECFPVVAHLVLLLLKIITTNKLEYSLRVSAGSTLKKLFCPHFSLSVASSVLPGLVSKLCKLASESFQVAHLLVLEVVDCLRIFIMKCFPVSCERTHAPFELEVVGKDTTGNMFVSIFEKHNKMILENNAKETESDENTNGNSEHLGKTISCLQYMLNHKNGPVFHTHREVRKATVKLLRGILLDSQVGMAKNLGTFMRSLCRFCGDVDGEIRTLSFEVFRMYQERSSYVSGYGEFQIFCDVATITLVRFEYLQGARNFENS